MHQFIFLRIKMGHMENTEILMLKSHPWDGKKKLLRSYLCLTSKGCHVTDFFGAQGINNRALSNIGVSNEANTDLLFIWVELSKNQYWHVNTKQTSFWKAAIK